MPISGLVITLADDASVRIGALAALTQHAAIRVGPLNEHRLPIVVDTLDSDEDRQVWEWLHALPGVLLVNVAVIHFDPEESAAARQGDSARSPPEYP